MISKKFTIYTKNQNMIFMILDVIQAIFGISITAFIVWAMLVTQNQIDIWTIIMGIAAIISLIDIVIGKTFNKHTFFHNFLLKLFKTNMALCKLRSNGMPVPLLRNGYSIFNGTKYR